ncbi:hypothetical protein JKP88DRAFT_247662 [Tribonema minus]|uniref:Ankyrin repeat domain-containing protein n=1 Tax=Tribonema minus TaxID=303371 RepID=A0A836CAD0_9STRA|nr:hypothetical protein JKP88DRAFT_247662 [Tribonema minus]
MQADEDGAEEEAFATEETAHEDTELETAMAGEEPGPFRDANDGASRDPPPEQYQLWVQEHHTSELARVIAEDELAGLDDLVSLGAIDFSLPTALGPHPAYLAVYHDAARVLARLPSLGVDLTAPCDGAGLGNCLFFAAYYGRLRCLRAILQAQPGIDVGAPCDAFGRAPAAVADMRGHAAAAQLLRRAQRLPLELQRRLRGARARRDVAAVRAAGVVIRDSAVTPEPAGDQCVGG